MAAVSRQRLLGIMTTRTAGAVPFENRRFYRQLSQVGGKSGLRVFVFTPQHIDWESRLTWGYAFDERLGRWVRQTFPIPDLVYDRCFFTNRSEYALYKQELTRLSGETCAVRMLGSGIKGKWDVHRHLAQENQLRRYLPRTVPYDGMHTLADWFRSSREAFLKPQSGSQGKGVLRVRCDQERGEYEADGRDRHNRIVGRTFRTAAELLRWTDGFTARRSYLVQQYLRLTTAAGEAFDVRSLVQKDGSGRWQRTGMAVRVGKRGSVTSNLHGGGDAFEAGLFLRHTYGEAAAQSILEQLERLSSLVPPALEKRYGRLFELGLDFGVDADGAVWLLEANSKPGRAVFDKIGDRKARLQALANPIRYAAYLLNPISAK